MSEPEVKYIEVESIKVIHLEPGDYLFLKHPARLSARDLENIRSTVAKDMPEIAGRVMILEEGMDIGVIRPEVIKK